MGLFELIGKKSRLTGMGSKALDVIGALAVRSWTCLWVRTANCETEVTAVGSGKGTLETGSVD